MRNLGKILCRNKYKATFSKKDTINGGKKIMLSNVFDENLHKLCDHLWVKRGQWSKRLQPGEVLEFTAVPIRYIKTHRNTSNIMEVDYTLTDIQDVKVKGWSVFRLDD